MALENVKRPTFNEMFPHIQPQDRIAIIGASGTGKSHLTRNIIRAQMKISPVPFLIYDSKHSEIFDEMLENGEMLLAESFEQLNTMKAAAKNLNVVYRPAFEASWQEMRDEVDEICRWAYLNARKFKKRRRIVIDEQSDVTDSASEQAAPRYQIAVSKKGREKGVGMWVGTQRPSNIPISLMSEARHYFILGLRFPDDRKKVARAAEANIEDLIASLEDQYFLYLCPAKKIISGPHRLTRS